MRLKHCVGLSFLFLVFSCAQQVAPTGGKKDDTPPKVIGCKPINKSTHFEADKITIRFDEYVQIKDPSQIVISPYLKDKPQIESIGKNIEIVFMRSRPEKNTTYTINFGNSIVDINEGNVLSNFSYVFASGDLLDSNHVGGFIYNAFTNKPEKDIVVGLYKKANFTDTTLQKNYPNYFAKSKEDGSYIIENLPQDTFYMFGFKDASADNKYQKNELISFTNYPVITDIENIPRKLFLIEPELHEENTVLDSIHKQKGKFLFPVYKPKNINIEPVGINKYYSTLIPGKNAIDTVVLYIPNHMDTAIQIFNIKTADTSYYAFVRPKAKSKYPEFQLQMQLPIKTGDSIYFNSNIPLDSLPISKIQFKEDTIAFIPSYSRQINKFKTVVYYPFIEGKNYSILIKDSIYKNVFDRYNKSLFSTFSIKGAKDYGNLIIKANYTGSTNLIIQLVEVTADEKVQAEIKGKTPQIINWNYIIPGNYKIKIIEDLNNNGIWDNGNFNKRQQAERVFYVKQEIIVKAYWDIEQSIDFNNIINN